MSKKYDGLRVSGRELLYRGEPVMLRGINMTDPIMGREDRPLSDYDLVSNEWNANVVRISIHPIYWREQRGKVLKVLRENVGAALRARMFPIIAWHTIGWPDGPLSKKDKAGTYDPSVRLAESFWKAVSKRYGNDGRVIFELWNEPVIHDVSAKPYVPHPWQVMKATHERLIAAIRENGDNLILAANHDWAYDLRGVRQDPLLDANTGYVWHIYGGNSNNDPREWAKHLDSLHLHKPVVVTEWGCWGTTPDRQVPLTKFGIPFTRDFLDRRGLHSVAWCWQVAWGHNLVEKDWRTPTPYGKFVRDYLRKHSPIRPVS